MGRKKFSKPSLARFKRLFTLSQLAQASEMQREQNYDMDTPRPLPVNEYSARRDALI